MTRKISTTRAELLDHKDQIDLARQGRDLLEQKRTVLVKEFLRLTNTVLQDSDALQNAANRASKALARAEAIAGVEAVRSAALAAGNDLPLTIQSTNVMGIKVPYIGQHSASRSFLDRGYSLVGTSVAIDEAAAEFEGEVEFILRLADSELRLMRLSGEIQRTSRRLNALEHYLIPLLEAELKFIQMALDERGRSDHFRLKLVKRALQRKGPAAG